MKAPVPHTPGPWGLSDETVRDGLRSMYVHAAPEGLLAIVRTEHQGRYYGEANARLIAAAPELIAAVREAERFMAYFAGETDNTFEGPGTPKSCLEVIRAAIAKAEGRS